MFPMVFLTTAGNCLSDQLHIAEPLSSYTNDALVHRMDICHKFSDPVNIIPFKNGMSINI